MIVKSKVARKRSATRRLGPKKTIFIGAIIFGLGYIISGQSANMAVFYLSYGFGTGIGSGLRYPTIMGYLVMLYPERKGTVSSIVAGVYGGASVIWAPLLAKIIADSTLAAAMLAAAVSGAMTVTVICLAVTALCYGGFGSTIAPITADLFGAKHVTENYGVMYTVYAFAGLVGPQLTVQLGSGGNYTQAFLAAAGMSAIAFIMAHAVRRKVLNKLC